MTDRADEFEAALDGFPTESAADVAHGREPVEVLASEFLERQRRGEKPTVEEYVTRYPHLAEAIREFLPVVATMESWKQEKESTSLRRRIPEVFSVEQLGDCRILHEIGRGGMGIVFAAVQDPPGRQVAVKLLPWRAADVPKSRDSFRREAQTLAKLRHANIVPLYSFGEYNDFCYFVMPFIQGVGLDWVVQRLCETDGIVYAEEIVPANRNQPPQKVLAETAVTAGEADWHMRHPSPHQQRSLRRGSWRQIALIGLQVANALRYAHARRILHNDIKPGNLLLDAQGRVWVTDFGLAQSLEEPLPHEKSGFSGTIRYMPPERFSGTGDERSDIYSLGITLYELMTLTPAFQHVDADGLIAAVMEFEPERPRKLVPDIPIALETIVRTAIAKEPHKRYQTAADFAADLLRFLNGRPVHAARRGIVGRFLRRIVG